MGIPKLLINAFSKQILCASFRTRPLPMTSRVSTLKFPSFGGYQARYMSSSLSKEDIFGRIREILSQYDKVEDPSKITESATFAGDLGLDSLDAVEVVMSMEEEFGIEIPDDDADEILSVSAAIKYISQHPNAK